jgi:hypothetical protein
LKFQRIIRVKTCCITFLFLHECRRACLCPPSPLDLTNLP